MRDIIAVEKYLQHRSDDVFLIEDSTEHCYSYNMLYESACHIAAFFTQAGLAKNDRLIVMMDNSILLAKIYFACLYAGITVIPISPDWTAQQIQFVIQDSLAKFILTSPLHAEKISTTAITQLVITAEGAATITSKTHTEVIDDIEAISSFSSSNTIDASHIAIIIYTSGTTAAPKGVMHTVFDLVGNGLLFVNAMGITEKNKFYNMLPMTYLGGYYNLLLIPCLAKASVIIAPAFKASTILHFWQNVIKHRVNTLWLVPTIMAILLEIDRSEAGSQYSKENIILALVGTAPLPIKLRDDFQNRYGMTLYENYGLSETLFITAETPQNFASNKGVGRLLSPVQLKIIEDEIVVSTPYIMQGYWGVKEGFDKQTDTWFYTGDLGHIDETGCLHVSGRKKDLIIKGGVNISPAAIEAVICQHEQVQECAVVGMPHALSGEEIAAVIKTKDAVDFAALKKDIAALCQQHLSVIQQPLEIIQLEELPRTYTGKIQKAKLRQWLVEHKNSTLKRRRHKENNFYQPSRVVADCSEALSIVYNTRVYELQSQNIDVTVLSLGEAFFDIPLCDFSKLPYPASYHYSHSRGVPKLRQVLADYFLSQYDVQFNPDADIIITAGSKIAIYMALLAVINPGDEVIIHEPAWVSYPEQVKLCHGIPIQVPYHETVFDFEKYITNRTKVLIVNNPNNPRGSILTLDEIAHLYKLAEKYKLYILSDEAYSDFVIHKEQFISIGNFDKEMKFSIICNSISKNFGISGWRIGYIIANPFLIEQILKLNQHLITCPATILEYYVADHFHHILQSTKPQIAELLQKRQKVADYIDKIGLHCLAGHTTFYLFLSIEGTCLSSEEFCRQLLDQYRVCVVPGIGYGKSCDRFVRVSIGAESIERIFSALEKIKCLIQDTRVTIDSPAIGMKLEQVP